MTLISQYENALPIEETPDENYFIRGLNGVEESVRIPFTKVGGSLFCDVEFVCFVENTQYNIPFNILANTTVKFEDRVNTNKQVITYKWRITNMGTEANITLYGKNVSYRFTEDGIYSVTLTLLDINDNELGFKYKENHITVSALPITLYSVKFIVKDNITQEFLEGVSVMFNNNTLVTNPVGEVLFENILENSVLVATFVLESYNTKNIMVTVSSNLTIEVWMDAIQTPLVIEYPPIYIGYLIKDSQGETLTEDIITGVTYPTQSKYIDPLVNQPNLPEQINVIWKNSFGEMDPFIFHTLFLAFPQEINEDVFAYYQNMDSPIVKGLLSTKCTIETFELGGSSPILYDVYKFNDFAPVNYRLSINSL